MNKLKAFWDKLGITLFLCLWGAPTILGENTASAIILGCGCIAVAIAHLATKMAPVYTCDTGGLDDTSGSEAPEKLEPKE